MVLLFPLLFVLLLLLRGLTVAPQFAADGNVVMRGEESHSFWMGSPTIGCVKRPPSIRNGEATAPSW